MSRDWERNFTSTMRETEENLSRMRNRLDPARYKPIDGSLVDSPPDYKSSDRYPQMRQSTNRRERPVSAVVSSSSPSHELYRHSTPSTGLVALLSEKVERQNKMIEQLSRQVNDLENDRRKDEIKVRDLEHQVNNLAARVPNKGQYDAEHNVDGWQRDVRNRLDELHERITKQMLNGMGSYHSEDALTSLTRDLHETKRALQSECDALHHEIETLRSRLVKQEMDTTGQLVDSKELGRKVDRLDRKFTKLSSDTRLSRSQQLSTSAGLPPPQAYSTQKDIRELKTEMSKILSSFSRFESSSQVSRNSTTSAPSTISIATVSSSKSSRRHRRASPSVSSTNGPPVSSPWQQPKHHQKPENSGSSTSIDDLSSSEISLPLSLGHDEDTERRTTSEDVGKSDQIEDDDYNDDFSLSLSDLEVSQRDGDFGSAFGSAFSLDSDQLDLDLM